MEPHPLEREGIVIGRYTIKRGVEPGKVWIEHESGEGGDFPEESLEALLHEFYCDNF